MPICRSCGTPLPENAKFCPVCGASAADAAPDVPALVLDTPVEEQPETEAQAAPVAEPEPEPEPVVEDVTDDSELIAVIAAAIAAYDNSGKSLVVRKVRRVSGWNRTARAEQVYRF